MNDVSFGMKCSEIIFVSPPEAPHRLLGPSSFYSKRTPEPVPKRVYRLRPAADHSPPPAVKVKNEWSYTSARPIWLLGSNKDNFTFLPLMFVRNEIFQIK